MVSTMTTRNVGRRTAATRGGGTSEQDGREGERSGDQVGTMVLTVERNHGEHLIRRFAERGNKIDPRDVKIVSLKQQIQELEFPQLEQDSPAEEAETESNVWDDGSEDVNPFGGGNPGFYDDHYDNPLLTKETESEPIIWDIWDEEEEYPFVNKYPSFQEELIVLVEEESCPVYDTDNEQEESMPVYDTDIEDVIEEEEGFVRKGGFGREEDNIEDVVVVANDLCSSMIQTILSVDFEEDINTKSHELMSFGKSIIIKLDTAYGSRVIRRIRNWSNALSYEVQALIRHIFLAGYGITAGSPAEEAKEVETESNVWDDGLEDVNPFGGGNPRRTYRVSGRGIMSYETDNEEEESMPVYDTDIKDVIEEEEGFVRKGGFGGEEDNIEDVVVMANDLCSSMIQTILSVDFEEDINTKSDELMSFETVLLSRHIAKDCRMRPMIVNPLNARNPTAARGACYECGGTDHYKEAYLRHESFDVIVGMDWLSRLKAEIVFHEKVVRIPLPNSEILRVLGEKPEEKELIETLAWAHERTPLANLIRWREKPVALSDMPQDSPTEEESMPVYDTDIKDVIEEEEGFARKGRFGGEEDNVEDVIDSSFPINSSGRGRQGGGSGGQGSGRGSQGGGRGGQGSGRGRQGGGRDDQESDQGSQGSSQGNGANGGGGGVPEFATLIAQQLQNPLPTIVAQVGNHVNNQGNNKNQDDDVVNDNNQGNVRTMNNDRGGCSYKEFMACNPKHYDEKGGAIVYTR
ncbi:retrovirus-related pol polyprotein from transposon TNT 1-94 [Tanacetum coccineum]